MNVLCYTILNKTCIIFRCALANLRPLHNSLYKNIQRQIFFSTAVILLIMRIEKNDNEED